MKDKFRADDPGQHEWLPSNLIKDVIENAVDSIEGGNPPDETALMWIEAHHTMRTPTNYIVFSPIDHLAGHTGALYRVERATAEDGTVEITLKQSTKGQEAFHDVLRDTFEETKAAGPGFFIGELRAKIDSGELLWHPGKSEEARAKLREVFANKRTLAELGVVYRVSRDEPEGEVGADQVIAENTNFLFVDMTLDQLIDRQKRNLEKIDDQLSNWEEKFE